MATEELRMSPAFPNPIGHDGIPDKDNFVFETLLFLSLSLSTGTQQSEAADESRNINTFHHAHRALY